MSGALSGCEKIFPQQQTTFFPGNRVRVDSALCDSSNALKLCLNLQQGNEQIQCLNRKQNSSQAVGYGTMKFFCSK